MTEIKTIAHPLENMLDLDTNTTIIPELVSDRIPIELSDAEIYDDKDGEIEEQFQEVYEAAMTAFELQSQESEIVEGKFKARNSEIAAQFLNTALNAAKEKANQKKNKDKIAIAEKKASTPNTVNQNVIVANRNDLLKQILSGSSD